MISDGKEITKDFGDLNKYEVTQKGSKVAVIGLGTFYGLGKEVAEELERKTGTDATVINPYYITGIDEELLEELKKDHDVLSLWKMVFWMADSERRSQDSMEIRT